MVLNRPIVGMSPTKSGQGYWLVASDGGIFAFGDATFAGSTGNLKLARAITGMATTPGGRGYWLTASDGGVFAFGDAGFHGAARERIITPESGRGIVAVVPTKTGGGYWQVAASGRVFAFGDAAAGLGGPTSARSTIVGMAARGSASPLAPANGKPTAVLPRGPAPQFFSSTANLTWGTSPSKDEKDKAGKGLALADAGNRVFVGGEFAGMVPPVPQSQWGRNASTRSLASTCVSYRIPTPDARAGRHAEDQPDTLVAHLGDLGPAEVVGLLVGRHKRLDQRVRPPTTAMAVGAWSRLGTAPAAASRSTSWWRVSKRPRASRLARTWPGWHRPFLEA